MPPSSLTDRQATVAVVVILLTAPAISAVPVTALPPSSSSYAVAQGTSCTVVNSITGNESVSDFYDYRNPNPDITGNPAADTYSSYGTLDYQRTSGSSLLFYTGTNGTSLVVVHDRLGDEDGGSTMTGQFEGLPADGSWVVQDDEYPNRDDDWAVGSTTTTVDWKWGDNRTDGGAYRGLSNLGDGTIVYDARFNEEAAHWGEWSYSGSDQYRVQSYTLWGADGTAYELALNRRVFIHQGTCAVSPPNASLTGPTNVETETSVTFDAGETTDNEAIGGFEWDFNGDGETDRVTTGSTVEHTFTEGGNYSVNVTAFDTYGNGDSATINVSVIDPDDPPTAALDLPSVALPNETVTLDASGSSDDEGIDEYRWDFTGDGTIDANTSDPTIEHSYSENGTYEPVVTVVDTNDSVDTATATIEISESGESPTASLSVSDPVTVNQSVTLDASASTDDGGIVEYRWDVDGDGTVDTNTTESTFDYTYNQTGTVEPTVTVVDAGGASASDSVSVSVLEEDQPPTANLTGPANATVDEAILLDASNSTDDRGIDEYRWDTNGDGEINRTTTTPEIEVSYEESGTFEATVTVVDSGGQNDSDTHTVSVTVPPGPPSASLSAPATATVNESVTLDASGSTDDEGIVEYRWDVDGDGTVEANTTESTYEHTYTQVGTYEPIVTVVDTDGSTGRDNASITVEEEDQPPTAALTGPTNATVDEPIQLNASNSTDDRGIDEYRWDIDGDGEIDRTTTTPEIEVSYEEGGTFDSTVTVVDSGGQNDSDTHTVSVSLPPGPPNASLSVPDTVTVNESVTLDASGSTDDEGIVEYRWDVDGDGTVEANTTEPTYVHTYTEADTYQPMVIVIDEPGGTDTSNASVQVNANQPLEAAFTVTTAEPTAGTPVQFDATESTGVGTNTTYEWQFGDGGTATSATPQHTYETSGTYDVTLTIRSDGANATASTQVSVAAPSSGGGGSSNDGGGSGGGGGGGGANTGGGGSDGGTTTGGNDGGGSSGADDDTGGANAGGSNSNAGGGQQSSSNDAETETETEPEGVARIETTNVSFNRPTLVEGQTLVVRATVENFGNASGTKGVEFEVDDTLIESRTLIVEPNETRTVAFTIEFTVPGTKTIKVDHGEKREVEVIPARPNLSVTSVSADRERIAAGEEFTLTATVSNTGHAEGTKTVRLELFDEVVAVEEVTLAPGERASVSFSRSIQAPGTYTAKVDNASATVQVTGTKTATATSDSPTETDSPGFGILAALIAVAGCLLAVRRAA